MYKCSNCLRVFEEGVIIENHYTYDEFYELEEVCPFCHNYIYKIKEGEENGD